VLKFGFAGLNRRVAEDCDFATNGSKLQGLLKLHTHDTFD